MNKNANFFADVLEELKKVTWPTKQETLRLTIIVFVISLIVAVYLGIIDVFLAKIIALLTKVG